ncbi:sulfurtransferase [Austwickia sp. TVS 96-490-7B]|uniref:sulfurtransferase n=1 Tax=Austwickia sp. TVS 96-490-7B TaxID=2830843 RepID=UPI001C59CF15|nr:sulfurtransferase [Austwickia sp. TVS 96-490-7B]
MNIPVKDEQALSYPLVDVGWLANRLNDPGIVVLDASIPPNDPDGKRIPGARRFDLEKHFSDPDAALPHTMPSAAVFQEGARRLGINDDDMVVVYDITDIYSAARAWWMFRAMGHERVAVLDGGLRAWRAAEHEVMPITEDKVSEGNFTARPRPGMIVDITHVDHLLAQIADDPQAATTSVVDARSQERFTGQAQEPRAGLRSGHMPGAGNLPYLAVQSEGRMLSPAELHTLVDQAADKRGRMVMSCGSGVTACVVALAARLAGYAEADVAVYDGSWTEWGATDSGREVVTGEAVPVAERDSNGDEPARG